MKLIACLVYIPLRVLFDWRYDAETEVLFGRV